MALCCHPVSGLRGGCVQTQGPRAPGSAGRGPWVTTCRLQGPLMGHRLGSDPFKSWALLSRPATHSQHGRLPFHSMTPGRWGEGEVSVPSTPSHFQTFLVTSFSHLNLVPPPTISSSSNKLERKIRQENRQCDFLQAPQSPESSEPTPYVMIFVILFSVKQQLITGQNSVWRGSGRVFRAVYYFIFTASSR